MRWLIESRHVVNIDPSLIIGMHSYHLLGNTIIIYIHRILTSIGKFRIWDTVDIVRILLVSITFSFSSSIWPVKFSIRESFSLTYWFDRESISISSSEISLVWTCKIFVVSVCFEEDSESKEVKVEGCTIFIVQEESFHRKTGYLITPAPIKRDFCLSRNNLTLVDSKIHNYLSTRKSAPSWG